MRHDMLKNAVRGDVVTFPAMTNLRTFRVVKVRDRMKEGLQADTLRRRPLNIRSQVHVTLRDTRTGRLQTRYFAENVPALILEI
jgi:hypothetical protein